MISPRDACDDYWDVIKKKKDVSEINDEDIYLWQG